MVKSLTRYIISAVLLLLTAVLLLTANHLQSAFFALYTPISQGILAFLGRVTGKLPFPLWEILAVLLLLWLIISLIRALVRKKFFRWLSGVVLVLSIGVTAFVGIWGLNYYAPSLTQRMGLPEKQYTVSQLSEAACYYRDMANKTGGVMPRDEAGAVIPGEFSLLSASAADCFAPLAANYDCFIPTDTGVKALLSSPLLAKTGTTGMFLCLTGESGVSTHTYPVSLPFTMCHEISHRMAIAREDEANFAAFLACCESDRAEFQYAGYYNAFLYCYNALYKEDPQAAAKVWEGLEEAVADDMHRATRHYQSLRNETAAAVTDRVYDGYLKSFSVEEGVQSYGAVADLLLIWYFEVLK